MKKSEDKLKLYSATLDVNIEVEKQGSLKKAISEYLPLMELIIPESIVNDGFNKLYPLGQECVLEQPDLLYITSTFASEGTNKNNDVFLRSTLGRIYQTAKHKFVDYEHD